MRGKAAGGEDIGGQGGEERQFDRDWEFRKARRGGTKVLPQQKKEGRKVFESKRPEKAFNWVSTSRLYSRWGGFKVCYEATWVLTHNLFAEKLRESCCKKTP